MQIQTKKQSTDFLNPNFFISWNQFDDFFYEIISKLHEKAARDENIWVKGLKLKSCVFCSFATSFEYRRRSLSRLSRNTNNRSLDFELLSTWLSLPSFWRVLTSQYKAGNGRYKLVHNVTIMTVNYHDKYMYRVSTIKGALLSSLSLMNDYIANHCISANLA